MSGPLPSGGGPLFAFRGTVSSLSGDIICPCVEEPLWLLHGPRVSDLEWKRFLQSGQRSERSVGRLSAYLNGFLLATDREIRMGHEYAMKAVEKHGLSTLHLPLVPVVIGAGEAFFDRPKHVTFIHYSTEFGRWFQVTVKCCTERRRLFVTTFRGLGADDVRRKRRRYQRVWPLE